MAYRLKNIRYQGNDRKILLQNENGPCPLLAAANALLLRGTINLPSVCIRNGCASLEEVVNMLAEKAMNYDYNHKQPHDLLEASNSEQYLHELMEILPKLQYGMDVNPKFMNGPSGMEFTKELTTFDLLNVKMVHGWLLDPESKQTCELVGNKTYNELIESVIHGNEASTELHKLEEQLKKLESCSDEEMIDLAVPADDAEPDEKGKQQSVGDLRKEFQVKQEELSKQATVGELLNSFLEHSSHQLTQYGLSILYESLEENELCVFFRNNHFSTITKHQGLLYLLVTDFGYANVPNVVWEKLDVIDGDTEYVNSGFNQPAPHAELSAASQGPGNLDPDQLLAQRGQSEADYQLALQLSGMKDGGTSGAAANNNGGGGGTANTATVARLPPTGNNLDEQEGKLMQQAMESSIKAYNGMDDDIKPSQQHQHEDHTTTQEDRDHMLAMMMQADLQQQDARLAAKMQQKEYARQTSSDRQQRNATAATADTGKSAGCVIS